MATKVQSETTNMLVYHIVSKKNEYYVYTPKLVRKGKHSTLKKAYMQIEELNKHTRLPVYEQDSQGKILAIKYAKRVRCLAITDSEGTKIKHPRKKLRIIHA